MKKSLLLASLLTLAATMLAAQNDKQVTCTILDVTTFVAHSLTERLDTERSRLASAQSVRDEFKELHSGLTWMAVDSLQSNWKNHYPYRLSDIDALRHILKYNDNNLPDPLVPKKSLKKVRANGDESHAYLTININCGIEEDAVTSTRLLKQVKPKVEVVIKALAPSGKMLKKGVARSVHSDFIKSESFAPDGFDRKNEAHMQQLQHLLEPLIGSTTDRAMKNMNLELH